MGDAPMGVGDDPGGPDVIQYGGHVQTKAVADGGRRTRIEFEMGGTT